MTSSEDLTKNETTEEKRSIADIARFYLTTFFVILGFVSTFAFIFLVPFVIEPGFSTLFAEFDTVPVTCITVETVTKFGMSNCLWSSCREGCTSETYKCTQIKVNYFKDLTGEFNGKNLTNQDDQRYIHWQYRQAKIFPNVKGCGYPPKLNCTIFNHQHQEIGTTYPCYYSTLQPNVTITHLDIEETKETLIYAIVLPWTCFIASVLYLLVTYTGMKKPDVSFENEPQQLNEAKASKEASNYSLRSISKTINHGVTKFLREPDDNGPNALCLRHRKRRQE